MNIYIGLTDLDWYEILKKEKCEEVNFWKPGGSAFKALKKDELFLFKLHMPFNYIVGGGFFVKFTLLPVFLAWEAFGIENGTRSINELNQRINKYRQKNHITDEKDQPIGCVILTEPFFFEREDWIPAPDDFSKNIVQGKGYDSTTGEGARIYSEVMERLGKSKVEYESEENSQGVLRFTEYITKHRLGQGAFRIAVADAYQRRCAITGEKTLPVLEAAHIRPYAEGGEHLISNGLLMKSDFHTLFDKGYITITTDYRVDVSKRLNEDYGNGKDYYKYHGNQLLILPNVLEEQPSKQYLEWHNEHVFLG